MAETLTVKEFAKRITDTPFKHRQRIIGIDGGGGAGKTTFAQYLQKEIAGSHVVKIDDFYRPPQLRTPLLSAKVINPNFDWDRIRTLIFEAVKDNREISYQAYDLKTGILSNTFIHIPDTATIIVEGIRSLQESFIDFYDYCIWLEAPLEIRLERGVSRDGEELRKTWEEEWIPIDEYYVESYKPHQKVDCIVDSVNSDFLNDRIVLL